MLIIHSYCWYIICSALSPSFADIYSPAGSDPTDATLALRIADELATKSLIMESEQIQGNGNIEQILYSVESGLDRIPTAVAPRSFYAHLGETSSFPSLRVEKTPS